ncbi:MAG: methyltransferase domain-containing protein [Planctomycetes bacterium]|nr:methyltransferase domain-containing protein [Planctomycetota bacterium]
MNWFEDAFRADYRRVYPHRDLDAARPEARWLAAQGLRGRVLDLCCGFGRHTLLLAESGLDVVGLDLSDELLLQARALPEFERWLAGRLVRGDARELPFRDQCFDGLVNLFSSFGYFGELGDGRVLSEVARVVRGGALVVLDLMNPSHVRANLRDESVREGDDFLLRERRSLLEGGRRVVKDVELVVGGEARRWREDVRLYELGEMTPRLADLGLDVRSVHGGFDGGIFDARAARMLIVAEKRRRSTRVGSD